METTPPKKRLAWPMLLLHFVAWAVTLAVGAAFIYLNMEGEFGKSLLGKKPEMVAYYGWPLFCLEYKETQRGPTTETGSTLHPISLVLNIVVGMLVVVSTFFVFVFPLWRQRKLFQFRLESLFILTGTIAVYCAHYQLWISFEPFIFFERPSFFPVSDRDYLVYPLYIHPLYIQIPFGLGVGCAIYWCIWIVLRLVSALIRILVKRRPVTQSE